MPHHATIVINSLGVGTTHTYQDRGQKYIIINTLALA